MRSNLDHLGEPKWAPPKQSPGTGWTERGADHKAAKQIASWRGAKYYGPPALLKARAEAADELAGFIASCLDVRAFPLGGRP